MSIPVMLYGSFGGDSTVLKGGPRCSSTGTGTRSTTASVPPLGNRDGSRRGNGDSSRSDIRGVPTTSTGAPLGAPAVPQCGATSVATRPWTGATRSTGASTDGGP